MPTKLEVGPFHPWSPARDIGNDVRRVFRKMTSRQYLLWMWLYSQLSEFGYRDGLSRAVAGDDLPQDRRFYRYSTPCSRSPGLADESMNSLERLELLHGAQLRALGLPNIAAGISEFKRGNPEDSIRGASSGNPDCITFHLDVPKPGFESRMTAGLSFAELTVLMKFGANIHECSRRRGVHQVFTLRKRVQAELVNRILSAPIDRSFGLCGEEMSSLTRLRSQFEREEFRKLGIYFEQCRYLDMPDYALGMDNCKVVVDAPRREQGGE